MRVRKLLINKDRFGKLILFVLLLSCYSTGMAQRIALKTNALYWATLSPNIEGEFRLSRHYTLDLGVMGNDMSKGRYRLKFVQAAPEVRYWFSRPMSRHYIGLTTFVASYDLKIKDTNYKGDAIAAGLTYGFDWVISRRCNIETSLGAGLVRYRCFDYSVGDVRPSSPNKNKTVFAPMKVGLSFSYLLY
jgi:hypothetical protein